MINLKRSSGILIPKEYSNEEFYNSIVRKLTRRSMMYDKSAFVVNKFFIEGPSFLKIPRYFPIDDLGDFKVKDVISSGQDIKINHNIVLRDDLQKNVVKYMLSNTKGIIQAPPGSGKTIVTIFAICELGKKTIILIHRDSLGDQWTERFLTYTNINPDEIGRLTSSNFKKCFKKSIIISTDQTFVSLLKRNREDFLNELNNSNVGILISDECHTTTGAPTFSECSIHIPAKRTYGLSATPSRLDETLDIMEYHLGDVWVPEGVASIMKARVTVLLFNSNILPKSGGYIYYGGSFQRSRYLSLLSKSSILIKISEALINKFYSEDKNILYVSDRIKLIETLFGMSKCQDKSKFISSAKNDMLDYKLTFATVGKIRDGVDAISKDTLIMSNPVGNIEQLTGRILRIKEGKSEPIIIDLVDINIKEISQTLYKRLDFYSKKMWNVKYMIVPGDGIKKYLTREQVMEIVNNG